MTHSLIVEEEKIIQLLLQCWSEETSSRYTKENPSCGQCGVTALAIQDHYGGEIVKTRIGNLWHFYNRIHGRYYDFTAGQFEKEIEYDHIIATRSDAFDDTNDLQYAVMSRKFSTAKNQ